MKRLLILLLAALPAFAQDLDPMLAECQRQMALGVCTAQVDKSQYPPGATVLLAGVGRIPLDAYLTIRNAGDRMCTVARFHCTRAPDGPECKTAKALWGR